MIMKIELKLDKFEFKGVSTERPLILAGPCSAESEEQVMVIESLTRMFKMQ